MMNSKMLIIPDVEYMEDEKYAELIELLESCPINYQVWENESGY